MARFQKKIREYKPFRYEGTPTKHFQYKISREKVREHAINIYRLIHDPNTTKAELKRAWYYLEYHVHMVNRTDILDNHWSKKPITKAIRNEAREDAKRSTKWVEQVIDKDISTYGTKKYYLDLLDMLDDSLRQVSPFSSLDGILKRYKRDAHKDYKKYMTLHGVQ